MRIVVWSCLVVLHLPVAGAEHAAPPLTDGERLAKRFERARNHDAGKQVIAGTETPELFLPGELWTLFLSNVAGEDAPASARRRAVYAKSIAGFGWDPAAFWRNVDTASAGYCRMIAPGSIETTPPHDVCAARIDALNAMRRQHPRFDEFLYAAVAPRPSWPSTRPCRRSGCCGWKGDAGETRADGRRGAVRRAIDARGATVRHFFRQ